eukprot:6426662-Lingulodinium_polyedra.AAC.1
MELTSPAGDLMVTGAWTGAALLSPKAAAPAPVLPTAGKFLLTPPAHGAPTLAAMTLRFFRLPVGISNAQARAAVETHGKFDSAFLRVEPCEADPDQKQLVIYVIYEDMGVA